MIDLTLPIYFYDDRCKSADVMKVTQIVAQSDDIVLCTAEFRGEPLSLAFDARTHEVLSTEWAFWYATNEDAGSLQDDIDLLEAREIIGAEEGESVGAFLIRLAEEVVQLRGSNSNLDNSMEQTNKALEDAVSQRNRLQGENLELINEVVRLKAANSNRDAALEQANKAWNEAAQQRDRLQREKLEAETPATQPFRDSARNTLLLAFKLRRNNPYSVSHELAANELEIAADKLQQLCDKVDVLVQKQPEYPLKANLGGHFYPGREGPDSFTSDCQHGCGCWMGDLGSGGPDGVDPEGVCPNNK